MGTDEEKEIGVHRCHRWLILVFGNLTSREVAPAAVSIPTANLYSQSPNQPPEAPADSEGVYAVFPAAVDATGVALRAVTPADCDGYFRHCGHDAPPS